MESKRVSGPKGVQKISEASYKEAVGVVKGIMSTPEGGRKIEQLSSDCDFGRSFEERRENLFAIEIIKESRLEIENLKKIVSPEV